VGVLKGRGQVREVGDEVIEAGEGKDAEHGGAGRGDQQQLAALGHS
jgi:hypothetical protein